jgi:hypothetical protein
LRLIAALRQQGHRLSRQFDRFRPENCSPAHRLKKAVRAPGRPYRAAWAPTV